MAVRIVAVRCLVVASALACGQLTFAHDFGAAELLVEPTADGYEMTWFLDTLTLQAAVGFDGAAGTERAAVVRILNAAPLGEWVAVEGCGLAASTLLLAEVEHVRVQFDFACPHSMPVHLYYRFDPYPGHHVLVRQHNRRDLLRAGSSLALTRF